MHNGGLRKDGKRLYHSVQTMGGKKRGNGFKLKEGKQERNSLLRRWLVLDRLPAKALASSSLGVQGQTGWDFWATWFSGLWTCPWQGGWMTYCYQATISKQAPSFERFSFDLSRITTNFHIFQSLRDFCNSNFAVLPMLKIL